MRSKNFCLHSLFFQENTYSLTIYDGCQHSHLVSLDAVKTFFHTAHSAEDVSTSHNYSYLHTSLNGLCNLNRIRLDDF